ncbi:MAG: RdgB/HAM1 family non-canonical purine NTP pyrophosphatase [Myxococcaceae bacterium]
MKLLFATRNKGKVAELRALVGDLVEVVSLDDVPGVPEVEEDGATFEDNARKKAVVSAEASGLPSLADDSGLCVDALEGRPGVLSARYAPGDDRDRFLKLLHDLEGVPPEKRGAAFRCVLCLAFPDGRTVFADGECRGRIAQVPTGEGGFGYDPVFELEPGGRTMAQLTRDEKSAISHRGRAFRALRPRLEALIADFG